MRPRRDAAAAYIQLKKGIIFCQRVTLLVIRERRLYRDILIYLRYTFQNSIYCDNAWILSSGRRIQQIRSRKKTLKNRPALQVTTYNSPLLPVSTLERYYFSIAWHPVSLVRDRKRGSEDKRGSQNDDDKRGSQNDDLQRCKVYNKRNPRSRPKEWICTLRQLQNLLVHTDFALGS